MLMVNFELNIVNVIKIDMLLTY